MSRYIFCQIGQIISSHTDVWVLIFGQYDGIISRQDARIELCGIALRTERKYMSLTRTRSIEIPLNIESYATADEFIKQWMAQK